MSFSNVLLMEREHRKRCNCMVIAYTRKPFLSYWATDSVESASHLSHLCGFVTCMRVVVITKGRLGCLLCVYHINSINTIACTNSLNYCDVNTLFSVSIRH
jgi:hypothetical protein